MNLDFKKIGNYIRERRTENAWSQIDLAEKLGVTRKTISKWEVGVSCPSLEMIVSLSKIFEISIDELLKKGEINA